MESYQSSYKTFQPNPAGSNIDFYTSQPCPQQITLQRQQSLRSQARKFKELLTELEADFYSFDEYYIISSRWINRWKIYVSYQQSINDLPSSKYIGAGYLPEINEDIVEYNAIDIRFEAPNEHLNVCLRQGLKSELDYIIVNKKIWQTFQFYSRIEIKRFLQQTDDGRKIEVNYRKINAIYLFIEYLKQVQRQQTKSLKKICIQLPNYKPVNQLITLVSPKIKEHISKNFRSFLSLDKQENVKVWIVEDGMTQDSLIEYFYKACKMNRSFSYKIFFPGIYLNSDIDITLSKVELSKTTLIAFQVKQNGQQWSFFNKETSVIAKCEHCYSTTKLSVICACKFAIYCSKQCKSRDKYSHSYKCDKTDQSQEEQKQDTLNSNSKLGKVGLKNLGNTCFMNSGIQCISSIAPLTQYFLEQKYIQEINTTNKLGTKGELCKAYAKLIKNMWYGKQSAITPSVLKRAISNFQTMFSGYQQHDSGELISFLLDGLHEDLNRIKQKPYTQTKDYDGRPDHIIAKQSWQTFLMRNKSIIVDLMYGQYRSKLDCPKCQYESIIFDPFLIFTLPIPQNNNKKIELIYVKDHIQSFKFTMEFQKNINYKIENLLTSVASRLNISNNLIAFSSSFYSSQYIQYSNQVNKIRKQYQHKNIIIRSLEEGENLQTHYKVRIQHSECHSQYGNQNYRRNITFQRMYLLDKNMTTKQIHHKLASYYKKLLEFQDYQKQIINVEAQDQKWRILIVTNCRYDPCFFCQATNCQNCKLPYSDDIKLQDLLKKIKKSSSSQFVFELEIYWRKSVAKVQQILQKKHGLIFNQNTKLQDKSITIYDCFNLSQQPEILQEENAWYCPKCKDFVLAKKQLRIYKAPKILIISFKRFKGKGSKGLFKTKLETQISFPVDNLDLTKYVINTDLPEHYFKQKQQEMKNQDKLLYQLFAISNHYGSLGGGHYTAYCKKDNQGWFEYDDSSVRAIDEDHLSRSSSYILFYRKKQ